MEIAALIIVLGSAGAIACLALGLALLAERRWRLPFAARWFALAGGVVGGLSSGAIISDWPASLFRNEEKVAVDQVVPYMPALRKYEENLYERISTLIVRDRQDGRTEEVVRSNAMALVLAYVADKASNLPDDSIYGLYTFTRDELAYMARAKDFDACAEIALGKMRGDIESRLSNELVERYRTIVLRIIETPGNPEAPMMGAEPFAVMVAQSVSLAAQSSGVPASETEALLAGAGAPDKTCKLMKGFFDVVLSQPIDVAAAALRVLAAGERTPR